ncbi:Protein CASC1 [Eumeta japonica]|uniref:Protein CASC1 n=1 Tax=Eumeta variegata TaxID=151549 RepID=A0A4C1WZT4_EUMVA|nr:Protein CASC1 [Eumeta japonica]
MEEGEGCLDFKAEIVYLMEGQVGHGNFYSGGGRMDHRTFGYWTKSNSGSCYFTSIFCESLVFDWSSRSASQLCLPQSGHTTHERSPQHMLGQLVWRTERFWNREYLGATQKTSLHISHVNIRLSIRNRNWIRSEPKNWKDMNPKERKAWQDQQIALWKAQQAEEKLAQIALAKEKRVKMAKARADLAQKNKEEQEIRRDILVKTINLFKGFERQKIQYANKKQTRAEWQQYLKCDGLPDPRIVTQMNTYLAMWRETVKCDVNELDRRCNETIPMLETLEELVANAKQFTAQQVERFNEVRVAVRRQLSEAIQCASYWLLRDIESNLKMETIKLSTFEKHFVGLRLNIWVAVKMPDRKPPPIEEERSPVELSFPSLKVSVKLPKSIDGRTLCVRAAKATIDLMSENSRTYKLPHPMPNQTEDLYRFNAKEYSEICQLAEEQDETRKAFYAKVRERKKELEVFIRANPFSKNEEQEQELQDLALAEPPFMPDPRTFIAERNAEDFRKYLNSCLLKTRTGEINLRKYRICGGILNLDLLSTPPQPKRAPFKIELTKRVNDHAIHKRVSGHRHQYTLASHQCVTGFLGKSRIYGGRELMEAVFYENTASHRSIQAICVLQQS